ncbi:4-hydroxy-2-oxovalerate aldolase [Methanobacterium ferruginis]|uniref:4-hydroxy-2-oxovalerate aldolase n=1 Tax=Methanobacterium ferruginis TaxID=710191 RepID=UPI00257477E4|nr:4-hydroxy-2-oxovalerate aldolase [Methanobacterium ferruginis]BDZ68996.1 4-hydroxy-2-oxovalerate aldolase [Methanobacterium ferruginis]
MKKIEILETTLRDGSYPINFSFNAADTSLICKELETAGFRYIEIGHGVGLNASNQGKGVAAQTDEEYMVAAEEVLKKAKYGMFCIPGIAKIEDIDLAAEHNMGFIRIGTNVTEVPSSKEYVKRAKEHDIFVTANFMKSYALDAQQLAKKVALSEKYGVDVVYIVDSAGGMFSKDIEEYYEAIRKVSDITLGFHGHDNLGLAVSNSIESAKMGIKFIDSSLQGLGRSSGNASTEILIAALLKLGFKLDIDFLKVLDIGQEYIQPLLTNKGVMPLDIVSGYAEFHSSYMHHIQKYSSKYKVRPELLIIEMCKINKVDLDENILRAIAKKIKKEEHLYLGKYAFNRYIGREQDE